MPEDYWTPGIEVPEGHEFVEHYGEISPVPQHDGTECFKWDNMLWSAEGHFKVRFWARGSGAHARGDVAQCTPLAAACAARASLCMHAGYSACRHVCARRSGALAPTLALPCPPHLAVLQYRWKVFRDIRHAIDCNEGGLANFAQGRARARPHAAACATHTQCSMHCCMSTRTCWQCFVASI